jgi:outer membrane biosynthesis protein TonB
VIRGIRVNKAYAISAVGHGAVLLWSVLSFAAKPLPPPPSEAMPVDIVSVSEFTQMTAGNKNAAKVEEQKPLVEKVAEAKPVEDPTAKVVEKKEVKAAREAPPPVPESKPAEPEKKSTEAKPDQVAEALAKDEAKKPEPKKTEAKPPTPQKKPAPPAPKFDPKQVEALLDKRDSTRLAAAGDTLNNATSLGASSGASAQISISELDALRQRLAQLWTPPAGAKNPEELVVVFRIKLRPDGRLAAGPWPQLVSSGNSPLAIAARESAARALNRGQPFDMLKPEHYEQWKDIEITFDPRDMFRGQ